MRWVNLPVTLQLMVNAPSTLIRKASVFESPHLGRRFQKPPFSWVKVSVFHRIGVDDQRKRMQNFCMCFRRSSTPIRWKTDTLTHENGGFRKRTKVCVFKRKRISVDGAIVSEWDLMRFWIKSSSLKHNGGNNIGRCCFFYESKTN